MARIRWGLFITAIIGLAVLGGPAVVGAAGPKVAVLPFLVNAKEEDKAPLAKELERLLLPALINPAMEVMPAAKVAQVSYRPGLDPTLAREAGTSLGADYVIFGSLTKLGNRISLDARILDMAARQPRRFYQQGLGKEALPEMVELLARDLKGEALQLKRVAEVVIEGNQRIEDEAISVLMRTKAGQVLDPEALDKDLKAIFRMGYFAGVKALTEDVGEKEKKVVIQVEENPAIREIEVKGGTMKKDEVLEAFNVPTLTVFNGHTVANGLQRVADLYRAAGYLNAEVDYELTEPKEGLANLILKVDPKNRLYIRDIEFRGNEQVKSGTLRKQMETDDWGIFSFITDAGVLKKEVLDKDVDKIRAYYHNHGYLKAQVGEPEIEMTEKDIKITVPVVEGAQYTIDRVGISGDLIKPEEELKKGMALAKGSVYSRAQLDKDREALHEAFASKGYAHVQVSVQPEIDDQTKTVALNYEVEKGELVYLERITVSGNTRTRDKVIRRELKLKEGELVDLAALRRSAFNLRRLQFFDEVEFRNLPGSAPNQMVMDVRVKERATGMFNIGLGYSTTDSAMIMLRIQEQNLFGRGQRLIASGNIGFRGQQYSISFIEPYLFDKRLSFSASVYNTSREYIDYDKEASGGYLGIGFPIWGEDTKMSLRYTLEEVQISNVNEENTVLKDEEGYETTSQFSVGVRRDTRDLLFGATKGSENYVEVDFAGLGGTTAFTKVVAGSGWFFPMPFGTTLHLQGKAGYVVENPWGRLPIFEKFFLGGINSLRGFKFASVSPTDPTTGERIGGERMFHANFELIFPLIASAGVKGVIFYDLGNAWSKSQGYDLTDLRQSIGGGIRWYSPVGPIRLEYGYIVRGGPDDGDGAWEFTIGSVF